MDKMIGGIVVVFAAVFLAIAFSAGQSSVINECANYGNIRSNGAVVFECVKPKQ